MPSPPMAGEELSAKGWNDRYKAGDTRWNKGAPAPPIVRLAAEGIIPKDAWVAVVGAGTGHEALHLAAQGYRVTAIDFAEEAAKAIRASAKERGLAVDVQQRDLFTLPADFRGTFHAIVEHTCFCAIDPARRADYVDAVHACLKADGLLLGLFYAHGRPGGPPFTTDEAEVRRLFEPRFDLLRLAPPPTPSPAAPTRSWSSSSGNARELLLRGLDRT